MATASLPRAERTEALPSDNGPFNGTKTASGTAAALASAQGLKAGVKVKALSTNTNIVYVGGSGVTTANGFPLSAGESEFFEVDDVSDLYVIDDGTGAVVRYFAS